MRFGLVHRIMTDALAVLGVLAVVSTASLGSGTNMVLVVGMVLAILVPERWQSKPFLRHFATIAPLALFVLQGVRLVAGRTALDVAVEFAALLQIVRLATRRGAAHDQQIIVLSLLHLVAGTVLGGGLTYGLCFLGFLVVAPGALVLSHLRREVEGNYRQGARDRTGLPVDVPRILRSRRVVGRGFLASTCLLSVPILLFTTLLFVLFPRVGLSLLLLDHKPRGRMVGFSDRVDLGDVGVLRSDPSIALRFDVSDLPNPPPPRLTLRLRGTAFDAYDGRAWARTQSERRAMEHALENAETYPIARAPDPSRDRRINFDLEPIDPPVIFLPPRTVAVRLRRPVVGPGADPLVLQRGPEGEFRYVGAESRGVRYDVYLANEREAFVEPLANIERVRYLALPPKLPTRIGALARQWTDGLPNDLAKAKALEDHLRKEYRYDLGSPSGGTPAPLDHFLFESKRGHCEFFSTAMAVMLREVGIPSRNVTGFLGGTYNRFGQYYAVREGDAHSWVEAYVEDTVGGSWATFDPTPPAATVPMGATSGPFVYVRDVVEALSQRWNRYVVGYDLRTQVRMFDELADRYERFRRRTGLSGGSLGTVTKPPVVAFAVLVGLGAAYAWWRRRRVVRVAKDANPRPERDSKQIATATALYRSLEGALANIGVGRPAALPPLRHAESLSARQHPLASEITALTETYLAARFGGATLDDQVRRDFERRVKDIRSYRPDAPRDAGI
ncbi:MAG: transglutaminaseTgpA domain-containing protein [Polyangiaceae bacterium]